MKVLELELRRFCLGLNWGGFVSVWASFGFGFGLELLSNYEALAWDCECFVWAGIGVSGLNWGGFWDGIAKTRLFWLALRLLSFDGWYRF